MQASSEEIKLKLPEFVAAALGVRELAAFVPVLTPRPDLLGKPVVMSPDVLPFEVSKALKRAKGNSGDDPLSADVLQYIGGAAGVAPGERLQLDLAGLCVRGAGWAAGGA